jgi:hypothetical protein
MSNEYLACKAKVFNRGIPPTSFLDELIEWASDAPDEIFAKNDNHDVYSSVEQELGPWTGLAHRKAVMLEVLRVLAGFESSWNWKEGRDVANPTSNTACSEEAGIFQCSGNAMGFDPSLKKLLQDAAGRTDCVTFIKVSKNDHRFAIEFCARLLRFTVNHNGPVKRKEINGWLRRAAVAEFQGFLPDAGEVDESETDSVAAPSGGAEPAITPVSRGLTTPHGRAEIEAMFGNPANKDGTLNEAWEGANIRKIAPPDKWRLFYQDDERGLVPVSGIRLHKLLEDVFVAALDDIWKHAAEEVGQGASDDEIRAWLHKRRLDQHGGGFNFRKITNGSQLSMHAYGIGIDWDPDHNPRKKPLTRTLPDWWFDVWAKHGWTDGRHYKTPDPMHVQFATGA